MNPLLRYLSALGLLATLAPNVQGQDVLVEALPYDFSRAAYIAAPAAQRTTSLVLPFFDDFTKPREGTPDPTRWVPGSGALVNNRLGIRPLTRGIVTLDGLRDNGSPYGNGSTYADTDILTSQPIDLSAGGSGIALSYALQQGSAGGQSARWSNSAPVYLQLEFLDASGRWQTQSTCLSTGDPDSTFHFNRREGTTFASATVRTNVIPITNSSFFHSNFQFRFRNHGIASSSRDAWSLDYILLDRNRPAADTVFQDVATSQGLGSPLQRYRSMPWWQYNAASATNELNSTLGTDITNLNVGPPQPVTRTGTVRDLGSSGFTGTWLPTGTSNTLTGAQRRQTVYGNARLAPLPATTGPKTFRYTLTLSTNEPVGSRTIANDTTYRDVVLDNYYAYDDGTAEGITGVFAPSTGPTVYAAYRFDVNQADQVQGLLLAPVFLNTNGNIGDDNANRAISIAMWADDAAHPGQPSTTTLATATATLPNPLPNGQVFYEVRFPTSVPVPASGTFYIGYGQPANGKIWPYGLDFNNTPAPNTLFRTVYGVWTNFNPSGGSVMMRPVMTNNVTVTATRNSVESAAFSTYPNPGHGTITVNGPAFSQASVLDAVGRTVWTQPADQAGKPTLELGSLPPGLYMLRLRLPDGSSATRRLVLE